MATEWFYKQSDEELGPYLFREMVQMVREERLLPETMVRPSYMDEWQRADSVVGLFYMSRKDPETLPTIPSEEDEYHAEYADADDLDSFLAEPEAPDQNYSAVLEQEFERPGWLKRLLALRSSKIPPVPLDTQHEINVSLYPPASNKTEAFTDLDLPVDVVNDSEDVDEAVGTGAFSEEAWSTTVNAAVERIDARAPKQEQAPPSRQLLPAISFSFLEHPAFRNILIACAIIFCASLGIYGFADWMGQGQLYFPLVGSTSPLLFLVYAGCSFLAVLVLVPLFAYIAAPYLRLGYRLAAALVTANVTVLFLMNWSAKQNMIFPSRKPVEAKLIFPVLGECSRFTYWMCFVDSVIFVAILAYIAAWWLEAKADEI